MIVQLFMCVLLIYLAIWRWKARHRIAFAKHFKNDIKAVPLLGLHVIANCKTDHDRWKAIKMFADETLKQGGAICAWNLHILYFLVADPVISECIMKSCLEKADAMKLTLSIVGNGSAVADVPIWRPRRKILVPIFSPKYLMHFEKVFSKQSMILMQQLKKAASQGQLSMSKYVTRYTMDSVCETALGVEAHAQSNPDQKLHHAFLNSCRLISDRIIKPWLHFTPIYKLTADYKEFMGYVDTIYSFIQDVITAKRKDLAAKNNVVEDEDRLKPILELMLETSGYSDTTLIEETVVIFTAGTDTSALATSFTSVLLARHPEIQEKVYQELTQVFGDSKRPVQFEDLHHLKYLECVIKESLRLYPPAPFVLRKIDKDLELPNGLTLPKGTSVINNVYATHRNPAYWGDDADQFRPERFIDTPLTHPAAFLAFSTGPRNCIAYRYAMMSMKTALSTLLRHFRVLPISEEELGQPIDLKFDIMLRANDDFQVKLEPRN
ncbi:cytochrome P450 4d8-like [Anticarsia gemmatalis]|uniref:cytochrome P450 4d8-like n=1 Tax=Anticarsia gemmatalis TaxID=129554 RepID=UPI003F7749FC